MRPRRLTVWPPLPPLVYARRRPCALPYPLDEPDCRLYAWGRHALWHGAAALGVSAGDEVLVPAYHHGSEVEALTRAGIVCRFYEGDESLVPDERELETLLGPRVRALHLIHYLGLAQDAPRWRRWCDERGLLLIEDAAQAWLASCAGQPVGSFGDLAIFSLYKSFGLAEGAALRCNPPPPAAPVDRRFGWYPVVRRHGAWLAQRSALATTLTAPLLRRRPYSPERDFDLRDPASTVWASVPYLLPRLARGDAAARRRANYRLLLERLGARVPSGFRDPAAGSAPMAFPVETRDKRGLIDGLDRDGIKALDFWSVAHPSLPAERFPRAAHRRATTVALPVHQELSRADVERIAAAAA